MRCALKYDEEKEFIDQNVEAWSVMQSLEEEPAYKETDTKDKGDAEWFRGYKYAIDVICTDLVNAVENEVMTEDQANEIGCLFSGHICEMLFSILDNQEVEDETLEQVV